MQSLAMLAQACVSWPVRADCVSRMMVLKETGAKTEREWAYEKTDVFFEPWSTETYCSSSQNQNDQPENLLKYVSFKIMYLSLYLTLFGLLSFHY